MDEKKLTKVFNMPEEGECTGECTDTSLVVQDSNQELTLAQSKNEQYIDQQIKDVIDSVDEAKEDLLNLARITESPRAYEVYSTLLNTKLNALSKLADIEKSNKKAAPETVNNTQINIDSGVNINELLNAIKEQ